MRDLPVIQHVPYEGPGYITKWAVMRGWRPYHIRRYRSDPLPDCRSFRAVVVMGGPMGVMDEADYPWLAEEKQWLAEVIEQGVMVLGVCLGAQLLAHVLGAEVYEGAYPEIGWFPIRKVTPNAWPMAELPDLMHVFHWHGDTFDLPNGAVLLAQSEAFPHQAFVWQRNVLALQFHMEMDSNVLYQLLRFGKLPLPSRWVQSPDFIRQGLEKYSVKNHQWLTQVLDAFFGKPS